MSNELQSLVAASQLNDYTSVVLTTAIVYDYIITFPTEINYVWNRPWTWISTLFVVVRYVGLFVAVWELFYTWSCIGTVLNIASSWAFVPFLAAADLVMILRVQAMYRGSRIVLGVLLLFYVPTMILLFISTGFYYNPNTMSVSTLQVLGSSFCSTSYSFIPEFGLYVSIPRFILAALMFIFALVRFFNESLQMYRATRQWLPSRYLNLLVRESVLYFLAHFLYTMNSAVLTFEISDFALSAVAITMLSYISLFTLCPRFIISVRELYVRGSQRYWEGQSGIDTGFGFGGQSGSSIRFANGEMDTILLSERASNM